MTVVRLPMGSRDDRDQVMAARLVYDVPPRRAHPGTFLCAVVTEGMVVSWDGGLKQARVSGLPNPMGKGWYPLELTRDGPGGSPPTSHRLYVHGRLFYLWMLDRVDVHGYPRFPHWMSAGIPRDKGSIREFRAYTDSRILEAVGLERDDFYRGLDEGRYFELLPNACVTTADRAFFWWDVQLRRPDGTAPDWKEWPLDHEEFDEKWRRERLGEPSPE